MNIFDFLFVCLYHSFPNTVFGSVIKLLLCFYWGTHMTETCSLPCWHYHVQMTEAKTNAQVRCMIRPEFLCAIVMVMVIAPETEKSSNWIVFKGLLSFQISFLNEASKWTLTGFFLKLYSRRLEVRILSMQLKILPRPSMPREAGGTAWKDQYFQALAGKLLQGTRSPQRILNKALACWPSPAGISNLGFEF